MASGGWGAPAVPVASAAQGGWVAWAVQGAWAVQATVRRSYLPAVIPGSITRSTVAARLTQTEPLPIDSVARHAAILWQIASQMLVRTLVRNLGSSLRGAATCPAVVQAPVPELGI